MIRELILNEYSLAGQFSSKEDFIDKALTPMVELLDKLPQDKCIRLWKKTDLWQSAVTANATDALKVVLYQSGNRLATRFKSLFAKSFLSPPYWDEVPKQEAGKVYSWEGRDVSGSALAEACERDQVIISWQHSDFEQPLLSVYKEDKAFTLINLSKAEQCSAQAVHLGWSPAPFSLKHSPRFLATAQIVKGAKVYQEISTGYYWYIDTFHNTHYEVFDARGKHQGVASLDGQLDRDKADVRKQITI